jgi:carbamoylphosphate synthase large subunit
MQNHVKKAGEDSYTRSDPKGNVTTLGHKFQSMQKAARSLDASKRGV